MVLGLGRYPGRLHPRTSHRPCPAPDFPSTVSFFAAVAPDLAARRAGDRVHLVVVDHETAGGVAVAYPFCTPSIVAVSSLDSVFPSRRSRVGAPNRPATPAIPAIVWSFDDARCVHPTYTGCFFL
jgi:hypothetical protein